MRNAFKNIVVFLLSLEARAVIKHYRPRVIAITGSVGKTSTKDAVFALLAAQPLYVRKSAKSFNSEIGLPLTILGLSNAWHNPLRWIGNLFDGLILALFPTRYPQWLVLEIGADRPGDIQKVARWLPVDIAVITRLPEVPVHVEFFNSPEEVVKEKAALIDALVPGGTLVLFGDDARAAEFRSKTSQRVITFGLSPETNVRAEQCTILFDENGAPVGMHANAKMADSELSLEVRGTVGAHMLLPALAAAAVGQALNLEGASIAEALKTYEPPIGRMHLIEGVKHATLIDDTYNSSPAAVTAALETLNLIALEGGRSGRRIAVLGDMLELGRHSVEEHRKAGGRAATEVDVLATIGFRARDIAQGALDAGLSEERVLQFERAEQAGEELAALLQPGDIVLLKGSQTMRMERAVKALMVHPEQASELLVRQDEEWQKR